MKPKSKVAPAQNKEPGDAPTGETRRQPAKDTSHEEIQRRAYEIHVERGGADGRDVDDWLQAERELKEKYRAG